MCAVRMQARASTSSHKHSLSPVVLDVPDALVNDVLGHGLERGSVAHHQERTLGACDGHVQAARVCHKAQGSPTQVATDLWGIYIQ